MPVIEKFFRAKDPNYGMWVPGHCVPKDLASKQVVFFGESHGKSCIIELQNQVMQAMATKCEVVHVIMEHFSFEMQHLLDAYQASELTLQELQLKYAEIGTEGHDVLAYGPLLEHAKANKDSMKLYGGFIPRTYAKTLVREGEENALKVAIEKDYVCGELKSFEGSDKHYNMFEGMISGRSMYDGSVPNDNFRKIFKAQLMKDEAMAHKVNKLIKQNGLDSHKYLVICGKGHCQHDCGVPERVYAKNPGLESAMIVSYEWDYDCDLTKQDKDCFEGVEMSFGEKGSNPSEYIYIYEERQDEESKLDHDQQVKQETAEAYNKVGETAKNKGNLKKAEAVMSFLGYTKEEFEIAGEDAYNYQGVGNPHLFAKIQPGERVLDCGSGLGIDSFIAAHYVGKEGKVVGLDLAKKEVKHANQRAEQRGANVHFVCADMEKMPLPDDQFDCVISNGAFCLAPNKEKAFREIYRVLKPGGRMAVCTSTVKMDLQSGVNWPICMRMFAHVDTLDPICKEIGFQSVKIDDTNCLMQYEIPGWDEAEEQEKQSKEKADRHKVHVGSDEFKHLKDYDMNTICARVTVLGVKPQA